MSTRLLVFLILQSWRFPASGGPVRWLVWSKLNKGILPPSLCCTPLLREVEPGLITNCAGWILVVVFCHCHVGHTGLMLLEGACALQSSGLILLDGVTQLDVIVVWYWCGNHVGPQYGFHRIINDHNGASEWSFNKTDNILLNTDQVRFKVQKEK